MHWKKCKKHGKISKGLKDFKNWADEVKLKQEVKTVYLGIALVADYKKIQTKRRPYALLVKT